MRLFPVISGITISPDGKNGPSLAKECRLKVMRVWQTFYSNEHVVKKLAPSPRFARMPPCPQAGAVALSASFKPAAKP
jgi:hypothetical protein